MRWNLRGSKDWTERLSYSWKRLFQTSVLVPLWWAPGTLVALKEYNSGKLRQKHSICNLNRMFSGWWVSQLSSSLLIILLMLKIIIYQNNNAISPPLPPKVVINKVINKVKQSEMFAEFPSMLLKARLYLYPFVQ